MLVRFTRYILLVGPGLIFFVLLESICGIGLAHAQYPGTPYPPRPNNRVNQQRGATFGGLMGAVAGGLIGDHNDEAGAGAAIGGVIGAVTGGILGNAADKQATVMDQRQAYVATQRQASIQRDAVSINDVVQMSRSGLSESVIINQIQNRGVLSQPQVSDIIAMHQQNVSERVITAMQQASTRQQITARPAIPDRGRRVVTPVIIEEHVLPAYPLPIYYDHHPHHHFHHGTGFHFDFGH